MGGTCMTSAKLYLVILGVLFASFVPGTAVAACDNSSNPLVIGSDCEDLQINNTKSDVTIEQSTTVTYGFSPTPYDAVIVNNTGNVTGTFLNKGTISAGYGWNALVNQGSVANLANRGTITSGPGGSGLINQGTITKLVNDGTITSANQSAREAAIVNNGEIGTLENKGTISATIGTLGYGSSAILVGGHIGTLNNTGNVSAQNRAITFEPVTSSIDTLINSGTIAGGTAGGGVNTFSSAIVLGAGNSIGTIINTGTIDHSVCQGSDCYASIENNGGYIGTITNLGRLTSGNTNDSGYGIVNGITGRIGTLNNDQEDLKYYGWCSAPILWII